GNPEQEVINTESDALVSYLDHLTAEQRDVILLRVVADQSIEVVAATLGKSIAAVKSIQYRATRQLRDVLEKKSDLGAT
ncbi:MAG: sigma-70 family RNA polymerase sigma factor, partial [Acidimicrobiales bacterium]|nr:sigma-70 family RNA polymerase sigma factor [Acidimicrobiales bacterium]